MVEVIPANAQAIVRANDLDMPAMGFAGYEDGVLLAIGGLAWGRGRCWLWFRAENTEARHAFAVVREGRRLLKRAAQLGETEVYTPRDAEYDTSERLLKLMGFAFHGVENGIEVWRWRGSPQ